MTHPTQEDDVKVNDIACLRINYDVEGWRKLTKGFSHCRPYCPGQSWPLTASAMR